MITSWFLVVTLCATNVSPVVTCDDYIVDGSLSYSDCQTAVTQQPFRENIFSVRCERAEEMKKGVGLPNAE